MPHPLLVLDQSVLRAHTTVNLAVKADNVLLSALRSRLSRSPQSGTRASGGCRGSAGCAPLQSMVHVSDLVHAGSSWLQELYIAVSTVTDAGFRQLSRLNRLQTLDASMCFKLTPK